MIELRHPEEIHSVEGGWFAARWHFSFDTYRAPAPFTAGVGPLRVFNDDRLVPGGVWPMHPHRDVEGITYVVEGEFRHADDVGGGGEFSAGMVQRMTLGSGALHSEQNASQTAPLRFLQFWLLPDTADLPPGVQQHQFDKAADFADRLRLVLGPTGTDAPVTVHQDATVRIGLLSAGTTVRHELAEGRAGYLYVVDGTATVDDQKAPAGAAMLVRDAAGVAVTAEEDGTEVVVVDVPLAFQRVGVWTHR